MLGEFFDGFVLKLQAESCGLELGATSKSVGSSMAQLLTAASQVCLLSLGVVLYSSKFSVVEMLLVCFYL